MPIYLRLLKAGGGDGGSWGGGGRHEAGRAADSFRRTGLAGVLGGLNPSLVEDDGAGQSVHLSNTLADVATTRALLRFAMGERAVGAVGAVLTAGTLLSLVAARVDAATLRWHSSHWTELVVAGGRVASTVGLNRVQVLTVLRVAATRVEGLGGGGLAGQAGAGVVLLSGDHSHGWGSGSGAVLARADNSTVVLTVRGSGEVLHRSSRHRVGGGLEVEELGLLDTVGVGVMGVGGAGTIFVVESDVETHNCSKFFFF